MVQVIEILPHGRKRVHLSCIVSSMAIDDPGDASSFQFQHQKD